MEIYPNADKHTKVFRIALSSGEFSWPTWCYLPVAASYAIVSEEAGSQGLDISMAGVDIGNLAAILAWRTTKGIYRFDKDLLASLWAVNLDQDLPAELFLNLPEWCCYIDLAGFEPAMARGFAGFFVYLECDANTGEKEIRLTFATEKGDLPTIPFHLDAGKTIADMLKGTFQFAKKYAPAEMVSVIESHEHFDGASDIYGSFFSLALYLCTADRDIVGPSRTRKINTGGNPKKQKRQLPVEYRVGTAIGGAIRRARGKAAAGTWTGEGSKKSPHMRKAHYHLYWTGPGRKIPKVKFILTIPVNIGDEPIVPIVRAVK